MKNFVKITVTLTVPAFNVIKFAVWNYFDFPWHFLKCKFLVQEINIPWLFPDLEKSFFAWPFPDVPKPAKLLHLHNFWIRSSSYPFGWRLFHGFLSTHCLVQETSFQLRGAPWNGHLLASLRRAQDTVWQRFNEVIRLSEVLRLKNRKNWQKKIQNTDHSALVLGNNSRIKSSSSPAES